MRPFTTRRSPTLIKSPADVRENVVPPSLPFLLEAWLLLLLVAISGLATSRTLKDSASNGSPHVTMMGRLALALSFSWSKFTTRTPLGVHNSCAYSNLLSSLRWEQRRVAVVSAGIELSMGEGRAA